MHANPGLLRSASVDCHGDQTIEKVGRLVRQIDRVPAHLRRKRIAARQGGGPDQPRIHRAKFAMQYGRPDAIKPGTAIERARHGERGGAQLLGIESESRALRAEPANGERTG